MSTEFSSQALQCFFRPAYPSSDSTDWSHKTKWSFISIPISIKVGCNQDSARDLLKRQQTSSNTSPCGNSIQQKQRQDSCSSTKMWVSDQGTWCYFLYILHPNSFQPQDRLVKLCQAEGTLQSDTPHPSCHVDEPGRRTPFFLGVLFFPWQRVGSRGGFSKCGVHQR